MRSVSSAAPRMHCVAIGLVACLASVAAPHSVRAQDVVVTEPVAHDAPTGFGKHPIVFTDLGTTVAPPDVKTPAGAETVRLMSAPVMRTGETALLDVYKLNGDLFAELLLQRDGQPWVHQNHLRLPSPFPLAPDKMTVTLRSLRPPKRTGYLITATDDAGSVTVALPTGFGGQAKMQEFLAASDAAPDAHVTYTFDDLDSRGFVIVKGLLRSAGTVQPADEQYFVWDGTQFIPRKPN